MSIITELEENWHERPLGEKRILMLLGASIVCVLFYLLVFDPIVTWREQEQKKLSAKNRTHAQVVRLVGRFQQQQLPSDKTSQGLASVIDKSLQANGLAMRGFQPGQKNDARLRLSDVTYTDLVQWLYDAEYQYNLTIEELSISQANASALLMANIRVRKN
ncbi:MAG: type II secretory pathway component PulM [Kiritimatiellia bacterium]|jgi:type II secretory pathway component PulM